MISRLFGVLSLCVQTLGLRVATGSAVRLGSFTRFGGGELHDGGQRSGREAPPSVVNAMIYGSPTERTHPYRMRAWHTSRTTSPIAG
jgi:hypothetical protein